MEEQDLFDLFEREEDIDDNTADDRFEQIREDKFLEDENGLDRYTWIQ
tara:strand:+ start:391 stop:534 length:144 start_codon:yes stop_codon:yes gene_type:complete